MDCWSLRWMSLSPALVVLLGVFLPGVVGQISTAQCQSSYSWMTNSKGQDPCLVAAYLASPCMAYPSSSIITGLIPGYGVADSYPAPGVGQPWAANDCTCNTVIYSLISACGVCQGGTFLTWPAWTASCSTVYVSQYPEAIPAAVAIPSWALLDVSKSNFDVSAAQANAAKGLPDSAAFTQSTATAVTKSTPGSAGTTGRAAAGTTIPGYTGYSINYPTNYGYSVTVPTGYSSPTYNPSSGGGGTTYKPPKTKVNIGAIIGGILGGLGTIGSAIGGCFAWCRRRKRKSSTNAYHPDDGLYNPTPEVKPTYNSGSQMYTSVPQFDTVPDLPSYGTTENNRPNTGPYVPTQF